jgi:hypothetical protein
MIAAGLPGSADEWPPGVLKELQKFSQGDLIESPPLAYLADPAVPIWEESRRFADELAKSGGPLEPEIILFPDKLTPPFGMIVSQTCDVVEEDTERPVWPWVQIVPVYDMEAQLDAGDRSLQRKGKGAARYLHVPLIGPGFYVADFRLCFPVEKGWLANQPRIDGFGSEELRQRVGDRVAALSGRPAFGGNFVATVQKPIRTAVRSLKSTNRVLYDEIENKVPELGIRLDSRLQPTTAQVVVLCDEPLSDALRAWWEACLDSLRPEAAASGIAMQVLDFMQLDQTPASEYRKLTILPMLNVSPS